MRRGQRPGPARGSGVQVKCLDGGGAPCRLKDSAHEGRVMWLLEGEGGEERVGQTLQGPHGPGRAWNLSDTPGEPWEESWGSGLCGPLCRSVGRPAGEKAAGLRQEKVVGRGRQMWLMLGFEGVWWPL